jgi:tetratricopeptide (TPR) repeat protein
MKLITTTALALVAAAFAAPAAAQYENAYQQPQQQPQATSQPSSKQSATAQQPASGVKPSSKAAKAIIDLQTTVNNKDYANLPAKVAAAQAVASTNEDRYLIAKLQLTAALANNDTAAMSSALDAMAASGVLDPAKTAELYSGLGGTLLNAKQYPQAAAAYQKAAALNPQNADVQRLLGISLFEAGQKGAAVAPLQKAIQASNATGQKASEDLYKIAVQAAFDARSPAANDIARQWLAAYPSPDSWRNSIAVYRGLNQPDAESTLDLMRLLQAAGALNQPSDYAIYISDAAEQNNYNEAQAVLDAGIAAKVIDPASAEFRGIVSGMKARPKATAADLAAATKSAQTGMALLHIGDRYYAMGDYAKAAELYRMAQGKPDVDSNIAKLHIGMALARQGDKAGAMAAFNGVTGPRSDIAKYWLTYLSLKA